MNAHTATICPYCGVGCGVKVETVAPGAIKIHGDETHPANFGRLCSKGAALDETMGLDGRLLHPEIRGEVTDWNTALATVANTFSRLIREHGPDAVAFYVSGQLLTEDYYVANKLMKGFIGSANIDTNSRLCMSSSVAGHKRAFGSDTVPGCYDDLHQANLIVLVGSNTAWCHPVLYQRIVQAQQDNPQLKVIVVDPRRTATCDIADLHLPLRSGSDAALFNGLLQYLQTSGFANDLFIEHCTQGGAAALAAAADYDLERVARDCELSPDALLRFYHGFAATERVVTVYSQGVNQSSSGSDKVNAIINCHLLTGRIGRAGMGPFSFTGQGNAMGGREVGGLANQLAAHMELDNAAHRDCVQRFWQSPLMAQQAGLKAVDLFQAIATQQVKAVWIMCTNPVVSLPEADAVRAALQSCELVVVSECERRTDTTAYAHVLLPAATWGEKNGTVTNSERCISRQRAFTDPPGVAKPDWWIIREVARRMGFASAFDYAAPADIFREHAALSGFENNGTRDFDISGLARISNAEYENFPPVQWPVPAGARTGTARLFVNGRFFTPDRTARFIAVTPRPPVHAPDGDYPWILNSGRSRDQWHTMSRTGRAARLGEHAPEPTADLHPLDAQAIGAAEGELVRVTSRWGDVIVRLRVTTGQRRGNVFVPIHWNDQFASRAGVGAVINAARDPLSGQPEFKHTPVRVVPYVPRWHGFLLSRQRLELPGIEYWARAQGREFYRYELAGETPMEDWPQWLRRAGANGETMDWIEYQDKKAGRYRGVCLKDGCIDRCLFVAPTADLPARTWLAGLFTQAELSDQDRMSLLTGRAPAGAIDQGRPICACFAVGANTIIEAIRTQGLVSVEQIGAALRAGTNCGSCIAELKELLQEAGASSAA